MDPAIIGTARVGYFRIGVYRPDWDVALDRMKRASGTPNFDVTRRELGLADTRDSTTGWRVPVTWTESTIEMINIGKGVSVFQLPGGSYAQVNELGQTADVVAEGDQILHQGTYYSAEYVKEVYALGDNFHHRDVGLVRLPLWQASPGSATWKTSPNDPRERNKTWIDTYARDAQITKDDGSTQASWATIFEKPPYPMEREFRAASSPVQGLYIVSQPNSTPMVSGDQIVRRYKERVPIHICTIDSTDVTAMALYWKMEAELRYIAETYPEGSQRKLSLGRDQSHALGSMWLVDFVHDLEYTRGTT